MVIFHCFEDKFVIINPIKPNLGLWISLNMIWRCYSLETRKRHCRCNYTHVLLCRKWCANQWRTEGGRRPRASRAGGHPKSEITKM